MRKSAALLSGVLLAALLPLPANAEPPPIWTRDSSDRLFPYETRPAGASSTIDLYAARNETEAAQIAVRPTADVQNVSVATTPLTGPDGATLTDISVRREYLHPNVVDAYGGIETDGTGSKYYDALVENTPRTLAANVTQPYFYSVHVPTGAKPGVYTGSATVKSDAGNTTVPIRVTVYPATLPPTDQSNFKMDNWTTSAGWDYDGTIKAIPLQYGVKMYDVNWWRVIEAMAKNHARHRNNVVFADFQALLIPNTTIDAAGNYTFGWDTFDRFLKIYKDAGALQWIHTPHLLNGSTDSRGSEVETLQRAADGSTHMVTLPSGSPEATAYLNKVFPALKQHLDQLGLTNRFYMSANDETMKSVDTDAANWMYAIYRKYFPKPLLNEATYHIMNPPATVTADTPIVDLYENNVGYFQTRKQNGTELWMYNSGQPGGTYLNRLIKMYLNKTRLIPLLAWKAGATGYLHWGWNYWYDGTNTPIDTFDSAQTGDYFLIRPNKAAYDIYDSLRSEAQTDGIEDYELFTQLAATKPVLAKALANSLLMNSFTVDKSGVASDTVHRQVLDALAAGGNDQAYPYADDFSGGSQAWQSKGGNWSVSGGALTQTDTSRWDIVSGLKGRAYGDVSASVDLQIRGVNADGGDTNWAGIVIRNLNPTDFDSGYLIAQRNNGEVFVYRNGTALGKAQNPSYTAGQVTRLRVVARGTKLTVYAGPKQLLTVSDPNYTAGGIGLASGGVNVAFDNVRINPDVNPAEGSKVTTSSSYEQDGWGAQAAVDGQRTSDAASMGWTSDVGTTAQFDLDLGQVRSIGRVDLYPRTDGSNTGAGFPIDYKVEVSTNGSAWTTVANRTNQTRPSGVQTVPFATRDARYVRVTGTKLSQDPAGASRMQFAEVEATGGNLAAGRPVTASTSSEYPNEGWLRSNLTDGARQSRLWNSMGWTSESVPAGSPQSVRIDLGGPSLVNRIDLYGRTDGASTGQGFPIDYTVETSTDGTTWTPVASVTGAPQPGAGPVTYTFADRTARYVQVRGTQLRPDGEGGYRMQLAEVEVRQQPANLRRHRRH